VDATGRYTRAIASYAGAFGVSDLTPDLVSRAKEIILDTVGAILLGSRPHYASVRILTDLAAGRSSADGSTVFGRDFKSHFLDALLANGTMGYAADAEGAGASRMHAAAVFVPTVLTTGEFVHASGPDAIAALCLAYDVACRVSDAADPGSPYPHSFHPSAVFGHFGAAAAAGLCGERAGDGVGGGGRGDGRAAVGRVGAGGGARHGGDAVREPRGGRGGGA
jgi:2-methylcitrate dehydratase PrpD